MPKANILSSQRDDVKLASLPGSVSDMGRHVQTRSTMYTCTSHEFCNSGDLVSVNRGVLNLGEVKLDYAATNVLYS